MKTHIPETALPSKLLQKRIICHWTVTGYKPDAVSLDSYHFVIGMENGKAVLHQGVSLKYPAPHTYAFNSAVGISLACMGGWNGSTQYPPTKEQWDMLIEVVAQIVGRYDIQVTKQSVLMHGEVSENLGIDQWGKWDIGYMPHLTHLNIESDAEACGDALRDALVSSSEGGEKIYVRIQGSPEVLEGLLFDGSGIVPVREACQMFTASGRTMNIESVDRNSIKVKAPGGARTMDMRNIYGIGYVSLRDLISPSLTPELMEIVVERWDAKKRILVVKDA